MAASYTAERKAGTTGSGAGISIVPASNCTTGSTLILVVGYGGIGRTITALSDTKGNTWNIDATGVNSTSGANISVCSSFQTVGLTTGDTITVTTSGSGATAFWLEEFAGNYSARDVFASAVITNSLTASTGTTTTTTAADEMAVCGVADSTATITKSASYTLFTTGQQTTPTSLNMSGWYRILAATGTQDGSGTLSAMQSGAGAIATYKAGGGAPPATKKTQIISSRVPAMRAALR